MTSLEPVKFKKCEGQESSFFAYPCSLCRHCGRKRWFFSSYSLLKHCQRFHKTEAERAEWQKIIEGLEK